MFSALYLFAYLPKGSAPLVFGAVVTTRGLGLIADLGVAAIAVLSLCAAAIVVTMGGILPAAAPEPASFRR